RHIGNCRLALGRSENRLQIGSGGGVKPNDHVVRWLFTSRARLALTDGPTHKSLHLLRDGDVDFVVVPVELRWIFGMPVPDGETIHGWYFLVPVTPAPWFDRHPSSPPFFSGRELRRSCTKTEGHLFRAFSRESRWLA